MFVRLNSSCRYTTPSGVVADGRANQVVEVDQYEASALQSAGRVRSIEMAFVVEKAPEKQPIRRRKRK